jgi:hypothetical protein
VIILDTNVLSALMEAPVEPEALAWLDRQPRSSVWTTSVTIMELRYGLKLLPDGRRQDRLESVYQRLIAEKLEHRIAIFDALGAEHAAILMAARRRRGQPRDVRDTMIAGIAVSRRATLATRNVRHFDDLPTPVVDPWAAP